LCWESGFDYQPPIDETVLQLLKQAWEQRLNCPQTTAVGRLFDAATALIGVLSVASFEGQGPMWLEAQCQVSDTVINLPLQKNAAGVWQTDWAPLLNFLVNKQLSVAERATGFHNSLAQALVAQALQISAERFVGQVGLSGGVFQNRRLTEQVLKLLSQAGFTVYVPQQLPCNDAAISFGQVIEYSSVCVTSRF